MGEQGRVGKRSTTMAKVGTWFVLTLRKVLYTDVIELFHLFHDQFLFVDLDDHRGVSRISPREPELAEGSLEFLRDVDGMGLPGTRGKGNKACGLLQSNLQDMERTDAMEDRPCLGLNDDYVLLRGCRSQARAQW